MTVDNRLLALQSGDESACDRIASLRSLAFNSTLKRVTAWPSGFSSSTVRTYLQTADALVARANWPAFLTRHPQTGKQVLALGWHPDRGLLSAADVTSSEMALAYFVAAGSQNSIAPECWYNTTVEYGELYGIKVLNPQHI